MTDTTTDLVFALCESFPNYVKKRVQELGLESPGTLEGALVEGRDWLRSALEELLTLPFRDQPRGPLEVFQEAMRFPTEALAVAGLGAVVRDPGAVTALPGDVYDLAPASSRLLGEEVWAAHMAWGAKKARALGSDRLVGLVSSNLMDKTRIESAVARTGGRLVVWSDRDGTAGFPSGQHPDLVLVDLAVPSALRLIDRFVESRARVAAFGPHVDRSALDRAAQTGAETVLSRSAFFAGLPGIVA